MILFILINIINKMSMDNAVYNNRPKTSQNIYDAFNELVFSNDTRVIQKMITKINFYNEVKDLFGDIFEFGVFKGASLALWLQLIKLNEYSGLTSVVGFDFFNKNNVLNSLDGENKELMRTVIERAENNDDLSLDVIMKKCNNILPNRVKLISGDASVTSLEFKKKNPGARIKLLYLDMDLDKPTYDTLVNLWDKVVVNGIVILDEYGFHSWDESNGVDRFFKSLILNKNYKLIKTGVEAPTLVVKKLTL